MKIEAKTEQVDKKSVFTFFIAKGFDNERWEGSKSAYIFHEGRTRSSGGALSEEKRADCKQQPEIQLEEIYEQQCPETQ